MQKDEAPAEADKQSSEEVGSPNQEVPREEPAPGSSSSGSSTEANSPKGRSVVPYEAVEEPSAQTSTESVDLHHEQEISRALSRTSFYPSKLSALTKEPFGDYSKSLNT